jgi:hypothetical protein
MNPGFICLLIHSWIVERNKKLVMLYERDTCCPIISAVQTTVAHDGGSEMLIQGLLSCGSRVQEAFVWAVIRRAQQVVHRKGVVHWRAVRHLQGLIGLTQNLVSRQTQSLNFQRAFIKTEYLSQFASALATISYEVAEIGVTEPMILQSVVHTTFNLFKILSSNEGRAARNCGDLVRGGAFDHLVRLLSVLPPDERAAAQEAITCLDLLGIYMTYPTVLKRFVSRTFFTETTRKVSASSLAGPVVQEFNKFLVDLEAVNDATKKRGFQFCDNPFVSEPPSAASKMLILSVVRESASQSRIPRVFEVLLCYLLFDALSERRLGRTT